MAAGAGTGMETGVSKLDSCTPERTRKFVPSQVTSR